MLNQNEVEHILYFIIFQIFKYVTSSTGNMLINLTLFYLIRCQTDKYFQKLLMFFVEFYLKAKFYMQNVHF